MIDKELHLKELKAIGYRLNTLRPLKALENLANKMATEECNGEREYTDKDWNKIEQKVRALFSKHINGLILNGDPRGYTLKIDDSIMKQGNYKLYQDWGGYGILCPEFK